MIQKYLKGKGIENFECLKEIGGGMELNRKEFGELLHQAFNGEVKEIVVAHADRFLIFRFDLFKGLLERRGVKITDLGYKMFSTKEEWSSEIRQIIEKV